MLADNVEIRGCEGFKLSAKVKSQLLVMACSKSADH